MVKKIIAISLCVAFIFIGLIDSHCISASDNATIRVRLDSFDQLNQLTVNIEGDYTIDGEEIINISTGLYTFYEENQALYLRNNDENTLIGNKMTLKPSTEQTYMWINNPIYGECMYLGNLEMTATSMGIQLINSLDIEQYLCGVIPAKVNTEHEIEAIKAQTIVARTYATYYMNAFQYTRDYDVTDLIEDQPYLGYIYDEQSIKAIRETSETILTYNNQPIQAYDCISNGGIIESTQNKWQVDLPYSHVKEDIYDLVDNPFTRWTIHVSKDEFNPYFYNKLLAITIERVNEKNNLFIADSIKINNINTIDIVNSEDSERLEQTIINLNIYAEDLSGKRFKFDYEIKLTNTEMINLFKLKSTRIAIEETEHEIYIYGSGMGHGIGLSQYGANALALDKKNAEEILGYYFYPAKCTKGNRSTKKKELIDIEVQRSGINPLDGIINDKRATYGYGTIITNAVNVREGAGDNYEIVTTIQKDKRVAVQAIEGKWFKIKHQNNVGYVSVNSILLDTPIEVQQPFPHQKRVSTESIEKIALPPEDEKRMIRARLSRYHECSGPTSNNHLAGMGEYIYAIEKEANIIAKRKQPKSVTKQLKSKSVSQLAFEMNVENWQVNTDYLNVRETYDKDALIVGQLMYGEKIQSNVQIDNWVSINTHKMKGYVYRAYLKKASSNVDSFRDQVSVAAERLNVRESASYQAPIIGQLKKNAQLEVLGEQGAWTYVRSEYIKGYVRSAYVIYDNNISTM